MKDFNIQEQLHMSKERERKISAKYNELLDAVTQKHKDETRHQTALKRILESEALHDSIERMNHE